MDDAQISATNAGGAQNRMNSVSRYICVGLEYFLTLLIVVECNSAYRCVTGIPNLTARILTGTMAVGLALLLVLLLRSRENLLALRDVALTVCMIFSFGVAFLLFNAIKSDAVRVYTLVFLAFLPLMTALFAVYRRMGVPYQLFYRLGDLVLVLAVASLILWTFSTVLGLLEPTGKLPIAWGDANDISHYFYLLMERESQSEYLKLIDAKIIRNIGIFPESPMYNIVLNMALYTELFLKERPGKARIGVLLLTILSTFGTIGITIAMGGCYFKLIQCNWRKPAMRKAIFAATALVISCVLVLILNKRAHGWGSYATHIDDYLASLKAWRTAPIFGTGFNNVKVIQSFMGAFRKHNQGLSNSIAVILAQGGLVLFSFYLMPFALLVFRAFRKKDMGLFFWVAGFFGIYVTTIFQYRMLLMMVLAFGWQFLDFAGGGMLGIVE